MSEIQTSALLARLIEYSKKLGNTKNPPFTAERFIVAIIDTVTCDESTNPDVGEERELSRLAELLKTTVGNLIDTKDTLMSYIYKENSTALLDDLYMKKKLAEASKRVFAEEAAAVDGVTLFLRIIEDPSDAIKPVLSDVVADRGAETKTDKKQVTNNIKAQTSDSVSYVNRTRAEMSCLVSEVKRIRAELKNSVYGQDNAINTFVTGYFRAGMLPVIDKTQKRPRATFLFAGPPGVGKTYLAEKAAEALKLPFMRFDMSEYADKEANLEFCGSDMVYKNGKAGNVTSFVSDNPSCVLLFDEIEKAHLCVIHLFLQMLDAGRLRDNFTDVEVSFKDAIIILTTNAGRQLYEESDFSYAPRKVIIKAIQKDINPKTGTPFFPDAICSRFASGNVVMFNRIGAHELRSIAQKQIERHSDSLEKQTGIKHEIDDRVYTALLLSEGSDADARTIRSRAETFFNGELYELLRLIESDKVKTSIDNIERIRIGVDLSRASSDICGLFATDDKTKVLVFARHETAALCRHKAPAFEFVDTQSFEDAVNAVKDPSIGFVLLEVKLDVPASSFTSLNIEDVESPARDFFRFLREQRQELPVFLLEDGTFSLSEEERVSFIRQGVRDVLLVSEKEDTFASRLNTIASVLHQQASMVKLARENKVISFETAQTVSENGRDAEIKLFDFKMGVAVESEDAGNILSTMSKPDVRFDDVIGAHDAKKELTYFVEYLRDSKRYIGTGVKAPRGVLLYGPPGTGKTMLAKAMACEAGVTFIAAEGNQFLKKHVGEGSEKVHALFKTARKYAPAILFIDEIDAIAKERTGGAKASFGSEETLTAFLTEMDGFALDPSKPVFVLAATNFDAEPGTDRSLDPALMRRFDRRIYIDLPNRDDRISFLKMKISSNRALNITDAQVDNIAMRATGMSLAELDSVVELALRSAIREGKTEVSDAILEEAFETYNNGETKKWDISQLERVARHEAGHALICRLNGEKPSYITVVARGSHGGYMQRAEQEGKAIYTKDELLARIRTSLGGRAAEIVYYGERDGVSTSASGDLSSATSIAQQIICTYGMDETFGLAVINRTAAADGTMSAEVRTSVNRILQEQMAEAVRLISENKDKIDSLVEELMSKNHLNGDEIESVIMKNGGDEVL